MPESELLPCPFCGQPPYARRKGANPHAECRTDGCFGRKMSVVNLDDPEDVAAWNRRPSSSEAGEVVRLVDAACRALEDWAHDLADTRDAYIDALSTGRMNGHRITKEAAKQYAHDFGERSSAVEGCVNIVRTAIMEHQDRREFLEKRSKVERVARQRW